MDLNNLCQRTLAELLEVSDKTIRDWAREDPPLPSHGAGRGKRYRWAECFAWWKEREYRRLTSAIKGLSGGVDDNIDRWEKVGARADAEMKLLKLADAKRLSLPADEVERRWAATIVKVRTQVLNVPTRLRAKWGREVADDIEQELYKACAVLAEGQAQRPA